MSILTSIGQGDHYFDKLIDNNRKLLRITENNIIQLEDGRVRYDGNIGIWYDDVVDVDNKCFLMLGIDEVNGDIFIPGINTIETLENCPKKVNNLVCSCCMNLRSLKGAPEVIEGSLNCFCCENLTSLEGLPRKVGESLNLSGCGRIFSREEIRERCEVGGIIIL